MTFAGMIRAKDEDRWIARCIKSLFPVCDHVFVMNDHSEDATAEIASSFDQVTVFDSPFDTFNETRDKGWLLQQITESTLNPDYVICIDGDEELEPTADYKLRGALRWNNLDALHLRIVYLWDREDQWRTDGLYSCAHRQSVFRFDPTTPEHREFRSLYGDDTTLHCTNVPHGYIASSIRSGINLYHYGYFDRFTRVKKYHYYNQKEAENLEMLEAEDHYRHMVIGDLFPPESEFKHGGPLRLESLTTLPKHSDTIDYSTVHFRPKRSRARY